VVHAISDALRCPQAKAAVEAARADSRKLSAQLQEAADAQEEAGRQLQELTRQIQVAEVRPAVAV
jgi:chromosome segregation ATPase